MARRFESLVRAHRKSSDLRLDFFARKLLENCTKNCHFFTDLQHKTSAKTFSIVDQKSRVSRPIFSTVFWPNVANLDRKKFLAELRVQIHFDTDL